MPRAAGTGDGARAGVFPHQRHVDVPFHMPGSLSCGCHRVSKSLQGMKGGVALLGTHPWSCL